MAALKDGDKIKLTRNTMIAGKPAKAGDVIELKEKGEVTPFDGARIIGAGRGTADLNWAPPKAAKAAK